MPKLLASKGISWGLVQKLTTLQHPKPVRREELVLRAKTLLTFLVLFTVTIHVSAYESWPAEGSNGSEPDGIIRSIEESIMRAVEAGAAHPDFLADLQEYVTQLKEYRGLPRVDPEAEQGMGFDVNFLFNHTDRMFGGTNDRSHTHRVRFGNPIEIGFRDRVVGLVLPNSDHLGAEMDIDLSEFDQITIEMWVYLNDWGPHESLGGARLLASKDTTMENLFQIFVVHQSEKFHDNALVVSSSNFDVMTPEDSLRLNTWHHIVFIHDGNRPYVMIDGVDHDLVLFGGPDHSLSLPTDGYVLGNDPQRRTRLAGAIAQVRVTDRARPHEELRREYAQIRADRPDRGTRFQSETIAGTWVDYGQHSAVIYNWKYEGRNEEALRNHVLGTGNLVGYVSVFGEVEEIRVLRAESAVSRRVFWARHPNRTADAVFEIRVNPDDEYRLTIVEVTVRKSNGDVETLAFSTLAADYRRLMHAEPRLVE